MTEEAVALEERELGTKPVKPLFIKYAATSLAGMIAQIVMVLIEGIIMGNGLGAHGLAASLLPLPSSWSTWRLVALWASACRRSSARGSGPVTTRGPSVPLARAFGSRPTSR